MLQRAILMVENMGEWVQKSHCQQLDAQRNDGRISSSNRYILAQQKGHSSKVFISPVTFKIIHFLRGWRDDLAVEKCILLLLGTKVWFPVHTLGDL